jgi:hypothetical protein
MRGPKATYSVIREGGELARHSGSTVALVLAPDCWVSPGAPYRDARIYRMTARRLPDRVRSRAVVATEGKMMTSFTSGTLVYWNSHTGFGQIELDSEQGRIDIYRTDLLRAGVRAPLVGARFHFSTGVTANGGSVATGLCPDI